MGKVYNNRQCSMCGVVGTIIESWGDYYCRECNDKRKSGIDENQLTMFTEPGGKIPVKGNGGMITRDIDNAEYDNGEAGITLERVPKGHPLFCNLFLAHYPASKGIMGRSLNYLVRYDGEVVGIIGGNSPPLNYKLFRQFFDTEDENLFLNNNVFRLIKKVPNLGTRVLSIFRKRIAYDYNEEYGVGILGFVTFVEPPRTGALYKADNWQHLGQTQGASVRKRDMDTWQNKEWGKGTKKHIYAIKRTHKIALAERSKSNGTTEQQESFIF